MSDRLTICAIRSLELDTEQSFLTLPIQLGDHLSIEDVSGIMKAEVFETWRDSMSKHRFEDLLHVRYAIVHRYTVAPHQRDPLIDQESWRTVHLVLALMRLIRPMRESGFQTQVEIRSDGSYDSLNIYHDNNWLEVPEVQKLYALRKVDILSLFALRKSFFDVMVSDVWKLRMAVQFFQLGHTETDHWKKRYFCWMAGIDALLSVDQRNHREAKVIVARLSHLLGSDTEIYDPEDFPSYLPSERPTTRVLEGASKVYALRHGVIHGHRLDDSLFQDPFRHGIGGPVTKAEALIEIAGWLLRHCIQKVLIQGTLDPFSSDDQSISYWTNLELTNDKLTSSPKK